MSLKSRIQDWARFQTILSVLAKHGFSGVLSEAGFQPPKQFRIEEGKDTIPRRLRMAFEELGPTFIKLGQLLSTRPDLLPETYTSEFEKLTDQIPSFPYEEVLKILESEFGRDPLEIYEEIEVQPLAAASISQVHRAKLRETKQNVVIKVQRPGITKTIESDIQILYFIAKTLERFKEGFKLLNLTAIIKEFQRSINEELDFTLEARNIDRFAENFPEIEGIKLPRVEWNYSTKKVLTMSELKGIPLSQLSEFPANVDRHFLAETIATFFFESMFFHGLFHADAHSGNILLNPEGRGQLALLDFGMVGTLSPHLRQKLSQIFVAVVSQDFESLAMTYTDIGEFEGQFSVKNFKDDVRDFLSPHLGKPLKEIDIGNLLLESTKIARKYRVKLPRDLIMFYRSLVTLEHIGLKLDPDFEFLTYGQKFGRQLMKKRFSAADLRRDLYKTIENLRFLGTELPTHLKTLVKRIDNSEFPIGSHLVDQTLENMRQMNRLTSLSFITFSFLLCSTLLTALRPESGYIKPLWLGTVMVTLCFLVYFFKRPKRKL